MIWFKLTEEGLKKRIEGGERWVGYVFLVVLIVVGLWLYFSSDDINFWAIVLFVAFYVCLVELAAYLIRRMRINWWLGFQVGYENDLLVVERSGQQVGRIKRGEVYSISESEIGLRIEGHDHVVLIPYEMSDYDQLLHRLRNWKHIEKLEDKWYRNVDEMIKAGSEEAASTAFETAFDIAMTSKLSAGKTPKVSKPSKRPISNESVDPVRHPVKFKTFIRNAKASFPRLVNALTIIAFLLSASVYCYFTAIVVLRGFIDLGFTQISEDSTIFYRLFLFLAYIIPASTIAFLLMAYLRSIWGLEREHNKLTLVFAGILGIFISGWLGYGTYF